MSFKNVGHADNFDGAFRRDSIGNNSDANEPSSPGFKSRQLRRQKSISNNPNMIQVEQLDKTATKNVANQFASAVEENNF